MEKEENALEVAALAGHILLENGAEISRVEETMERIATHYGVESKNFFILSNGIFTWEAQAMPRWISSPSRGRSSKG